VTKKTPRQRAVLKADKLWADLIKRRDSYACRKCKKQYSQGDRGIQASHIIPRGKFSTRWHPQNGKALCYACHLHWHSHPTESSVWAVEEFGPALLHYVNERSRLNVKYLAADIEAIVKKLKSVKVPTSGPFKWPSPYDAETDF